MALRFRLYKNVLAVVIVLAMVFVTGCGGLFGCNGNGNDNGNGTTDPVNGDNGQHDPYSPIPNREIVRQKAEELHEQEFFKDRILESIEAAILLASLPREHWNRVNLEIERFPFSIFQYGELNRDAYYRYFMGRPRAARNLELFPDMSPVFGFNDVNLDEKKALEYWISTYNSVIIQFKEEQQLTEDSKEKMIEIFTHLAEHIIKNEPLGVNGDLIYFDEASYPYQYVLIQIALNSNHMFGNAANHSSLVDWKEYLDWQNKHREYFEEYEGVEYYEYLHERRRGLSPFFNQHLINDMLNNHNNIEEPKQAVKTL